MNLSVAPPTLPLALSSTEVLVALVFVVGGLIKHFLEKANNSPKRPVTTNTPPLVPPRPEAGRPLETPEEKAARRLMEALGRPANQTAPTPPPPLPTAIPRPVPPPLPPNVFAPPRQLAPPPLPLSSPRPEINAPPESRPAKSARNARRAPADLASAPAGSVSRDRTPRLAPAGGTTAMNSNLRGILNGASLGELRRAILLREVLGPPRALSEFGGSSM